jgi:hypothetical protein
MKLFAFISYIKDLVIFKEYLTDICVIPPEHADFVEIVRLFEKHRKNIQYPSDTHLFLPSSKPKILF